MALAGQHTLSQGCPLTTALLAQESGPVGSIHMSLTAAH